MSIVTHLGQFSWFIEPYQFSFFNSAAYFNPLRWSEFKTLPQIYNDFSDLEDIGCNGKISLQQQSTGQVLTLDSVAQAKEFISNDCRRYPGKWDFSFSVHIPIIHLGD